MEKACITLCIYRGVSICRINLSEMASHDSQIYVDYKLWENMVWIESYQARFFPVTDTTFQTCISNIGTFVRIGNSLYSVLSEALS